MLNTDVPAIRATVLRVDGLVDIDLTGEAWYMRSLTTVVAPTSGPYKFPETSASYSIAVRHPVGILLPFLTATIMVDIEISFVHTD